MLSDFTGGIYLNIIIEQPSYAHIPEIARICATGWKQTVEGQLSEAFQDKNVDYWYNHNKVREDIDSGSYSYVALIGSKLVGTIGGMMTTQERGDIFVLYVDENYRYQGIGHQLLDEFTKEQVSAGVKEQWVSVQKDNWRGIPFYESNGFVLQEENSRKTDTGEIHISLKYKRKVA